MDKIMDIDRHNKEAVRRAIKKRGATATIGNLPLYYSDDRTLHTAILRAGVIVKSQSLNAGAPLELVERR